MRKKLVALFMAVLMAAATLTACGGDNSNSGASDADAGAQGSVAGTPDSASVETPADSADGMVSDETFAVLQQNYETMLEYYNVIANAYNSDEIAANPDIETVMNKAADTIVKMGEVKQDMLTEEDAVAFNDSIISVVNGLITLAGAMEKVDGAGEAEGAQPEDGATGDLASEEMIAALKADYASLVEVYNSIAAAYNNGEYEKNEAFEAVMNECAGVIEQLATYPMEGLTVETAQELSDTIMSLIAQIGEFTGDAG